MNTRQAKLHDISEEIIRDNIRSMNEQIRIYIIEKATEIQVGDFIFVENMQKDDYCDGLFIVLDTATGKFEFCEHGLSLPLYHSTLLQPLGVLYDDILKIAEQDDYWKYIFNTFIIPEIYNEFVKVGIALPV
jgi:DNA-binding transcriptional ArsR family regulator